MNTESLNYFPSCILLGEIATEIDAFFLFSLSCNAGYVIFRVDQSHDIKSNEHIFFKPFHNNFYQHLLAHTIGFLNSSL